MQKTLSRNPSPKGQPLRSLGAEDTLQAMFAICRRRVVALVALLWTSLLLFSAAAAADPLRMSLNYIL
jgi:hypothetical protein